MPVSKRNMSYFFILSFLVTKQLTLGANDAVKKHGNVSAKENNETSEPLSEKDIQRQNLLDINPDILISNDTNDVQMEINPLSESESDMAARLGLTPETFKRVRHLLKDTTGIDLGTKPGDGTAMDNNDKGEGVDNIQEVEEGRDRAERSAECPDSPPGVVGQCIPCKHDDTIHKSTKFSHIDDNGNTCMCVICRRLTYMSKPCTCTPDGNVLEEPTCDFASEGESFMPYKNWCSKPFPCKTCLGDLVVTNTCTLDTDTQCGCPEFTDQTGSVTCTGWPRCPENYGITRILPPDGTYLVHVCEPCEGGFIQPRNDSFGVCIEHPFEPEVTPKGDNEVTTMGDGEEPVSDHQETMQNETKLNAPTSPGSGCSWVCNLTTLETDDPKEDIIPKITRILDPLSLAAIWVLSLVAVFLLGVFVSSCVMEKYRQWCDSFSGRKHQSRAVRYYSEAPQREQVVISMEANANTGNASSRIKQRRKSQRQPLSSGTHQISPV